MKKLLLSFVLCLLALAANAEQKRVFFIGDSMTGLLAERFGAYGQANDIDVVTIVWDGSNLKKWGENAARLKHWVNTVEPDVVFINLGMNDLWYSNYEGQLGKYYHAIVNAVGNRPLIWIGPMSWPGKFDGKAMTEWLGSSLNAKSGVFETYKLTVPRQSSTNPHANRTGSNLIIDEMVKWLRANNKGIALPASPKAGATFRGPNFLYLRMKDAL